MVYARLAVFLLVSNDVNLKEFTVNCFEYLVEVLQ